MFDDTTPVFVISVAAQLAGMHPQTLRQYDRLGLVSPGRTPGRGRRYSARDVAMLREVQRLSQEEGVNLAGIKRILELEVDNARLRDQLAGLEDELHLARARLAASRRVFAAGPAGDIEAYPAGRRPRASAADPVPGPGQQRTRDPGLAASTALVVWRPRRP